MYRDFFGLALSPFNNTPDPRFFFNTPDHEEAVASLIYAAQERKGFSLLTGEVGSGKTLVSRLVLSKLERSAKFAVVHNTRVGPRELLFSICREFDVRVEPDAAAPEMSRALEEFLLDQYARDRLAVVVVDEAQHLSAESFEELRLLGNLEANDAKLMSVLILGQPELQETFGLPEMRQLQQRLFRSFHLKALTRELTEGYIAHRLRVAGIPRAPTVFDRSAIDAIFAASGGIPRLINQICDGALLAAYGRSVKRVNAAMISEVIEQSGSCMISTRNHATRAMLPVEHDATDRVTLGTRHTEEAVRLLEDRVRELESATVEGAVQRVSRESAAFEWSPDELKAESITDLRAARSELDHRMAEAARIGAELEGQSQGLAAQMTAASRALRHATEESLGEARQTQSLIREQSGASLSELREAMTQINERASTIRGELAAMCDQIKAGSTHSIEGIKGVVGEQLRQIDERSQTVRDELFESGEQIKNGSARSVEGLKQVVAGLLHQIDAKQLGLRSEIEQASIRIQQTEQQIAEAIAATRENARQIIDEAKEQAQAIQSQAQASAATIQEQATAMLAEARRIVEQMRAQAEATVRRADATAESTCRDLQDLRSDLRKDRDHMREQILASKVLMGEARNEAARLLDQARSEASRLIDEAGRIERDSQSRVEQLLQQARESEGRTESLMRMPRELIDEANARSAALAEMSRTVSSVVSQLGAVGDAARAQSRDIREASTLADDRLELLKQHTARVGQLVGIIRQLYGAMDARIEGLRDRLDQADELCRSVPDEINSLRSALTEKRIKRPAAAITTPMANKDSGIRPALGKVVAQIYKGSEIATGQSTLGDIVSRNRKLHEWLRDTLREAGSENAVGRIDGVDDSPQPNRSAVHEAEDVSA